MFGKEFSTLWVPTTSYYTLNRFSSFCIFLLFRLQIKVKQIIASTNCYLIVSIFWAMTFFGCDTIGTNVFFVLNFVKKGFWQRFLKVLGRGLPHHQLKLPPGYATGAHLSSRLYLGPSKIIKVNCIKLRKIVWVRETEGLAKSAIKLVE